MASPTTDHYFEAHITIDPVLDDERRESLDLVASWHGFRVAELLMKKTGERSGIDDFLTARSIDYDDIEQRTEKAITSLKQNNFVVRRYKIENTLVDVRFQVFEESG